MIPSLYSLSDSFFRVSIGSRGVLWLVLSMLLIVGCSCRRLTSPLTSPDGRIWVELGDHGDHAFTYAVYMDDQLLVKPSSILLRFLGQPSFGAGTDLTLISSERVDETWEPLWGKREHVQNRYSQYVFRLVERGQEGRSLLWILRIYDDGVAFRYHFPADGGFGTFMLTGEEVRYRLNGEWKCWATNHGGYYTSQEHPYDERMLGEIGEGELIGCPLLAEAGGRGWIMLTEADLTDWAGLYFVAQPDEPGVLTSSLAPLKRWPEVCVEASSPADSPWRVIMCGEDPGRFIESDLIANLNDPSEYADVSWIEPGRSAWDRWWSGDYGPDAGFRLGMNTATMKYFIDLAHEMEWEYMIVDWTWYGNVFTEGEGTIPDPSADITTPADGVDIRDIISYADQRDVKIILWVLSAHLDRQMDEALDIYREWGAAGIKVDFMDCDDQDMVNWYHRVAREAARRQLVVDFHGAYKPTGVSRTLPNMLTREGVLGNEYTKWSDLVTPRHTVVLPFTRGVLGEMDFTPGGFHHIHQEDFVAAGGDAPNPYVMGTRCHQLAMTVIYESAFLVICDSPFNYRGEPGTDFLRQVPSTWSDTRFLQGYPGESVVLARRQGDRWFLAGMTNEDAREVEFSLDFMEKRIWNATLWRDASDAKSDPASLEKTAVPVDPEEPFRIRMERGGGFVAILE